MIQEAQDSLWGDLPLEILSDIEGQLLSSSQESICPIQGNSEGFLFQPLGSQTSLFPSDQSRFNPNQERTFSFNSLFNSNSFSLNASLKREDSQSFSHSPNNFQPQISHPFAPSLQHSNVESMSIQEVEFNTLHSPQPQIVRVTLKELARLEAQKTPSEIIQNIPPLSLEEKQQIQTSSMLISQIKLLQQKQEHQINELKNVQVHLMNTGDRSTIGRLKETHISTLQQINLELQRLYEIFKSFVLDGDVLNSIRVLEQQLQFQACVLELLHQELTQFEHTGRRVSLCRLLITEQPLPHIMFKGKVMDLPYGVTLLTGTNENFTKLSDIEGKLVADGLNSKSKIPIENNVVPIDGYQRLATFNGLKINISSRMSMISIKFSLQVTNDNRTFTVDSPPSFPFIIITNESQWVEATSKLIMMDAFGGLPHIPWPQFANTLHKHFLSSTRQEISMPERPLHFYEMRYFHTRINGGAAYVSQQQASHFFSWFGNVERTIRFKRHIYTMWCQGLIYGFFTKDYCEKALSTQGVGSFLVRFSESQPGLFAIAYVSDDPEERVKHYLVKQEDISTIRTLPDFIGDNEPFQYILKIDPLSGKLMRLEKEFALKKYYSKRKQTTTEGYVNSL